MLESWPQPLPFSCVPAKASVALLTSVCVARAVEVFIQRLIDETIRLSAASSPSSSLEEPVSLSAASMYQSSASLTIVGSSVSKARRSTTFSASCVQSLSPSCPPSRRVRSSRSIERWILTRSRCRRPKKGPRKAPNKRWTLIPSPSKLECNRRRSATWGISV